jgi:hypothetical protein
MKDNHSFLLGKAGLASPSFSCAWHSSAPACFILFSSFVQHVPQETQMFALALADLIRSANNSKIAKK